MKGGFFPGSSFPRPAARFELEPIAIDASHGKPYSASASLLLSPALTLRVNRLLNNMQ